MSGTQERSSATALQAVSNTLVKLHEEQFGRGPTNARSYFAGPDTLVCTLEDSLLPAERTMVEMGRESPSTRQLTRGWDELRSYGRPLRSCVLRPGEARA
jgi:uncharacterized protein YbcI